MKKTLKLFSAFCLLMLLILTSCNNSVIMYTVKFNTDGGTSINSIRVKENSQLALPSNPTKPGFEFDGWYLDNNFKEALPTSYTVTKTVTLYAKWNKLLIGNLIDIELDYSKVLTTYNALESFDSTNLLGKRIYDNGDVADLDLSEVTFDKTILHGNDTKVLVSYQEFTKEIPVTVNKLNYDLSNISFNDNSLVYNGNYQTLSYSGTLPLGLRAQVVGEIKDVGTKTITLEFENQNPVDYNTPTSLNAKLTITPLPLDLTMFKALDDVSFTGNPYTPKVESTIGLVENTCFTVSYSNNIEVGKATVKIEGINNYKGEIILSFNILSVDDKMAKEGRDELYEILSSIFTGTLSNVPSKLPLTNSNNSVNTYYSSTTGFIVDEDGNVNYVLTKETQDVTLTVIVRFNNDVCYLEFKFKLEKLETKIDEKTLIEVDNLKSSVSLKVKELSSEETSNIIIKTNEELIKAYDISLLDKSLQKVELNGNVKVKLPVPSNLDSSKLTVYYVDDTGNVINMNASVVDNYLEFNTNHFSVYIITLDKKVEVGTIDNPYTVNEALELKETTENVYVKGTITKIDELNLSYGNATFNLGLLKCFRVKNINNTLFTKANDVLVGDEVVIYGKLSVFDDEIEIDGYIVSNKKVTRNIYNVSLEDALNGKPVLSNKEVEHGLSTTLYFNPNDGYAVESIVINGTTLNVSGTSIDLIITETTSIKVNYKKLDSNLTNVLFDFTSQGYSNSEKINSLTLSGVSVSFSKGTNTNNAPAYYTSGNSVRIYGGNTFTISSSSKISQITFTFATGGNDNLIIESCGKLQNNIWTGDTNEVTFTIDGTSGQRRIKEINVSISSSSTSITPVNYQITFDSNGGTEILPVEVLEQNKLTKPTDPYREGYKFVCWLLDDEEYDFSRAVTSNFTLVAKWESEEKVDILYELVKNISQLQIGSEIIIVHKDGKKDKALGIIQNNNNRAACDITFVNNLLKQNNDMAIINLCEGKKEGTFALQVTNGDSTGYLYSASSSNNYLRTEKTLSDNSSWNITIDSNGNALIKSTGTNSRNILRYNSGNNLFSSYASGQQDIQIYIKSSENLTNEEIVEKEVSIFSINNSLSNGYNLPTKAKLGSTITWTIDKNHTANLINNKLVNNENEDLTVTLYAKFTYGDYTSNEVSYQVTIRKSITNSDVDEYYESILATEGDALKMELRDLITSTHTKITSYDDCKTYLQEADEDPNNSNNMLLFYTGTSITKTANMSEWNREHVWCQSLGWFTTSGAGADLHHIRPCSNSINSSRGNKKFGESSGYFTPNDEYKGDVARIIFYLMVRYAESDNSSFEIIAESLELLLEWNELDPVSETEIIRNNYIYTIQGNRNPFIDNSDYAQLIWG